jgi:hypothetical protein
LICLVALLAGTYSVGEYHDGAPRAFHELVGLDLDEAAGILGEGEALTRAWAIVNLKHWSP